MIFFLNPLLICPGLLVEWYALKEICMETMDQMNLHQMMEERLEKILIGLETQKKPKRKKANLGVIPANREVAEWNLSEIPILYGA